MKRRLILGFLLILAISTKAQYYQTGVEPFSVRWRQMSAGKIRLIFPSESETIANHYLKLLTITDTLLGKNYNLGATKLDVVLHNHTVLSNGFVAWAPRRMELITHPAYDGYAQLWSSQLAIHEMRHVKQLYALNQNTVKAASYIFGQQATGLAAGFVPMWYLEGDAVASETAYSHTGRGRTAGFYQHYRVHYLSNAKNFSYDKWLLGSYKDFIPNHYSLGYQIVAYGNLKYGNNVWPSAIDYVSRKPYTIFPFYFGLKKQTGLSRKSLTEDAFDYQDSVWTVSQADQRNDKIKFITSPNNSFVNYQYPRVINNSTIIAYKTSLTDIPAFVQIDITTKKEKIITRLGYLVGRPFINDSIIVWSEYKPHARWEYKSNGKIITYNLKTGKKEIFSHKGMFGAPTIHPASGSIYCIEYLPQGQSQLVMLTNIGKSVLKVFDLNNEPFELAFDETTAYLYVGVVTSTGKEVWLVDQGNHIKVYGPTYLDINSIRVKGDSLLFSASGNDRDILYYVNTLQNNTYKLVNSIYSLNYIDIDKSGNLFFSCYTPNGYRVATLDTIPLSTEVDVDRPINDNFTKALSYNASALIDTVKVANVAYKSKPYRGVGSLFNFHSWTPFYFNPYNTNPEESSIKPGVTVMSQNLTGSTVVVLGYGYGNHHLFNASVRYYGFWPVFSFGFEQLDEAAWVYQVSKYELPISNYRNRFKLYTYLPFTLSNSSIRTYLQLFNSSERTNDYLFDGDILRFKSGLFTMNNGLYFSVLRNLAHRDLLPKFGMEITTMHVNAPYNNNNIGTLSALISNLYLPGIWHNQHLKLRGSVQNQSLKHYYLSNKVEPPRGYALYRSENYRGFSADYLLPLAYPDLAIGSLSYIKRISLDIFFDYAQNSYPARVNNQIVTWQDNLQSVGFEVNIDLHLLRTRYPFRLKYQQAFTGNTYSAFANFSLVYDIYGGFRNRLSHIEH